MTFFRTGLAWRFAALRNGFLDATAYRLDFAAEVLGSAIVPAVIQLVFWYAAFVVAGKGDLGGYSYRDLVLYTGMSVLFSQVRGGNHDFELAEMIREGSLSNYLLRPVSVVEFVYIRGVAPKLLIAGASLIIGMIAGHFLGLEPSRMVGAMFLALLGNVIHYQVGATLAASAFYWEESYALLMVKNLVVGLLSGELIPLHLFPESMSWLWKSTPFYLYVYGPAQYASGKWTHAQFLEQIGIAFVWIGVWTALVKLTWRMSIRRYLSLGG
jgi:ABC-2 type transport system permease protein